MIQFPGPEISLGLADYAKVMCCFLDIPVHQLQNKKNLVESLHVLFTLYNEFKQNPYFHFNRTGQVNGNPNQGEENAMKFN